MRPSSTSTQHRVRRCLRRWVVAHLLVTCSAAHASEVSDRSDEELLRKAYEHQAEALTHQARLLASRKMVPQAIRVFKSAIELVPRRSYYEELFLLLEGHRHCASARRLAWEYEQTAKRFKPEGPLLTPSDALLPASRQLVDHWPTDKVSLNLKDLAQDWTHTDVENIINGWDFRKKGKRTETGGCLYPDDVVYELSVAIDQSYLKPNKDLNIWLDGELVWSMTTSKRDATNGEFASKKWALVHGKNVVEGFENVLVDPGEHRIELRSSDFPPQIQTIHFPIEKGTPSTLFFQALPAFEDPPKPPPPEVVQLPGDARPPFMTAVPDRTENQRRASTIAVATTAILSSGMLAWHVAADYGAAKTYKDYLQARADEQSELWSTVEAHRRHRDATRWTLVASSTMLVGAAIWSLIEASKQSRQILSKLGKGGAKRPRRGRPAQGHRPPLRLSAIP